MGKSKYLKDLQKKPSTQSAGQAATNDVMRITNDLIDNNYKERAAESQRQNDSMIDNVNQHLGESGKGLADSFIQSGKDIKGLFTPKDLDVEVSASESIQSFVKTILIATNAIVNPINSAVTMATDAATAYMDYAENFLLNNEAAIITQDVVNTIHDFTKVASEVGFGSALTHYSANFIFEGLGHIKTGSKGWDDFLSGTGTKASEIFSSFFGADDSQTLARYIRNFESERQQKANERKNNVPFEKHKEMQYYTIVDDKLTLTKHDPRQSIHTKSTANVQSDTYVSDAIKARNSNYSAFNNSAIKQLLQANADLLTNMFDIAIVTTNKDGKQQTNSLITMFQPNVKVGSSAANLQLTKVQSSMTVNTSTIPVRTASIVIPQSTTNTSQISFIEEKIEIPGSTVSFSNEATMSIELDANNYVFEMFQGLAGMKMPGRVLDASGNLRNNDFKIQAAITNSNATTIDIVVEAKRLHGYDDKGKAVLANDKLKKLLLFVFEDVRFLGSSDGINFERNAAGLITKNISFIFKRISKVYSSLVNEG